MTDAETLVVVDAPHFYAGLVMRDGACIAAAPILKWAVGKRRAYLSSYFRQKSWRAFIPTMKHHQER